MSVGNDSSYLKLWRRMKAVVQAYTSAGRQSEADYCMVDFFLCFDDLAELERHVQIAERSVREVGPGAG